MNKLIEVVIEVPNFTTVTSRNLLGSVALLASSRAGRAGRSRRFAVLVAVLQTRGDEVPRRAAFSVV